jgi:hypothetical protein
MAAERCAAFCDPRDALFAGDFEGVRGRENGIGLGVLGSLQRLAGS